MWLTENLLAGTSPGSSANARTAESTDWAILAVNAGLFSVAYFLCGEFGHQLTGGNPFTLFWPASGLYLAMLVLQDRRQWPVLVLAAVAANIVSDVVAHGKPFSLSLGYALANSVEVLVGATLLRRMSKNGDWFQTTTSAPQFILCAALIGPAIGASIGAATVLMHDADQPLFRTWCHWISADMVGVLLVAPVLLGWETATRKMVGISIARLIELLLLFTASGAAGYYALHVSRTPIAFIVLPCLIYAAIRLDVIALSCTMLLPAVLGLYAITTRSGPFQNVVDAANELVILQMRIAVTQGSLLVLLAVVNESRAYRQALEDANRQLEMLAVTDSLTQLANRRSFDLRLAQGCERATRCDQPFSLLLIDVDRFKAYNDEFGHPAGDEVLRDVGAVLKALARRSDLVARYGGEEFVVLLPATDQASACVAAERCRLAVASQVTGQREITVSIGVCTFTAELNSSDDILKAADHALYTSKGAGRNRCTHIADCISVENS